MTLDINQIRTEWINEYPGDSRALTTLREILISADCQRLAARQSLDDAQSLLAVHEVQHFWTPPLNKSHHHLTRQNAQAERHFIRALQALEAHLAHHKPAPPKPPEPPPKPDLTYRGPTVFRQTASISIVDGKTVTHVPDFPAAAILKRGLYGKPAHFRRQLCFADNCMPEEYAYAFTHNGETSGPAQAVFITYTEEEFFRLCQLEIDTNSPHLLDGERVSLTRLE